MSDNVNTQISSIKDLIRVPHGGIKSVYVENWIKKFRSLPGNEIVDDFSLTSLQKKVANHSEAFDPRGPNLLITGPTSAGKTLAAEMLMANHLTRGINPVGCIYAVPLRALTTEKHEHFLDIFGKTKVYASSSDYQEYDPYILNRGFRIVVVVYEKLYNWLLNRENAQRIISRTGLLIVDELQMLNDAQRGAKLELILTFFREHQMRLPIRIVGLGPDETALNQVAQWLRANSIGVSSEDRPVPLVEGFIPQDGIPRLQPLPDKLRNVFKNDRLPDLPNAVRGRTRDEMTENLVVQTLTGKKVGQGKRILVYCATKRSAEDMTDRLARALGPRQKLSSIVLTEIDELEGTITLSKLRETIKAGVAFHHGDLNLGERTLVESLFKSPYNLSNEYNGLDVVVCTPTLSMGVNLPADWILFPTIDTFRTTEWEFRGVLPQLLTPLEYKNFAGRAGRYRPNPPINHHGLSIFISDKDIEDAQRELVEGLINGNIGQIEPALHRWPFGLNVLALGMLAWKNTQTNLELTPERLRVDFSHTYAGFSKQMVALYGSDALVPIEDAAVEELKTLDYKLVGRNPQNKFELSNAAKAVASHCIHIRTFEILERLACQLPDILQTPLVLIEELVQAPEVIRLYPTRIPQGKNANKLALNLRRFLKDRVTENYKLGPIANDLINAEIVPDDNSLSFIMRIVAIWMWINGEAAETISECPMLPEIRYGAIATLADQLGWLMGALVDIWNSIIPSEENALSEEDRDEVLWDIKRFEYRLRYGVPEGLESVAHLRVRGWHRERLVTLWQELNGWEHPVFLLDTHPEDISPNLRSIYRVLQSKIRRKQWPDDPRTTPEKQVSLAHHSIDNFSEHVDSLWPEKIRGLYLSKDDYLVQNLTTSLTMRPILMRECSELFLEKDRGGAPDAIYETAGSMYIGLVVWQGTILAWKDVRNFSGRTAPNGKPLEQLIIVSTGTIDDFDQLLENCGDSILVLGIEAFAQLCVRGIDDPIDPDNPDDNPSALIRVRNIIERSSRVLRTAEEVDRALDKGIPLVRNEIGYEDRGAIKIRPRKEIFPYSESLPDSSPKLLRLRSKLALILDELNDYKTEDWDISKWIREAAKLLIDHPALSVGRCRVILEALLKTVYSVQMKQKPPSKFEIVIQELDKLNLWSSTTRGHISSIQQAANRSLHPGEAEIDGYSVFVPFDMSSEDAVIYLQAILRVGEWFTNWRRSTIPGEQFSLNLSIPKDL